MSATTAFLPLRAVRRMLGHVDAALRPATPVATAEALAPPDRSIPSPDEDEDATTTRELLVPARTGEPPAARASRQAQDYLERRRRKLNRQLDER